MKLLSDVADPLLFASLFWLYAEIHYKFKGVYSRLKKAAPEIIADVPRRLRPGAALPVLLLVKDADRFPVEIIQVVVEVAWRGEQRSHTYALNQRVAQLFWWQTFHVEVPVDWVGWITVDVRLQGRARGRAFQVRNDNYACTSHAPFRVWRAEHDLPATPGWCFGEFHCHSNYTNDQVEFGAPLEPTVRLARALGLRFFCATDHSYDLDDLPDDYLRNDPELRKWHRFREEVAQLNRRHHDFVVVPGEEVSVGNGRNRNVHFLVLNHPEFLPGKGDGAEAWPNTQPDLSIPEVLARLGDGAVAFAAHPGDPTPWLETLLLRRGRWRLSDCRHAGLHGLQIWNGTHAGLENGLELWKRALLRGQRLFISGGNDAHGNFNRFRQIGFPFLTMREHHHHIFGHVRTGVRLSGPLTVTALLQACKHGQMVATDGPFVDFELRDGDGRFTPPGGTATGANLKLTAACRSSPEFGALERLVIYRGDLAQRRERCVRVQERFSTAYEHLEVLELPAEPGRVYYRVELFSRGEEGAESRRCLSNPIWVEPGRG